MLEIKIEAPDLAAAICKLAAAIAHPDINTLTPDEPRGIPAAAPAAPVAPVAASEPAATVNPTPAHVAPVAAPVAHTAPVPTEQPAAHAPAAVPVTAPTYTVDQIARAGASLVDAGKMEQLLTLLARYGVAAVTQLQPDQFGAFATELRALGAQI